MNHERVKYNSTNNDTKKSIVFTHDPKGWDKSDRTLKREKNFGIMTELSKNLTFVKEAADFYNEAYEFKGGEADITLEEYRFNPNTSHPYLYSSGTHDFSEFKGNSKQAKVPFKSGGLNSLIKSQIKEKFELERLESINGNVIDPIEKQTVALTSREILLVSQLESTIDESSTNFFVRTIPMETISNSDQENIPTVVSPGSDIVPYTADGSLDGEDLNPNASQYFYLSSDVAKTIDVDVDIDLDINGPGQKFLDVAILHRDAQDDTTEFRIIYDTSYANIKNYAFTYSGTFDLEAGDSLLLIYIASNNQLGTPIPHVVFNKKPTITVTENSEREDSQTVAVFLKDVGEKLMQIITGEKGRFYSNFLTNGTFSKAALTSGFWIRQFYEKNMQISLDEFLTTLNAVFNIGYGIEVKNGKETLVVEDLKYFFQSGTAIFLNEQVTDLEYENAKEFCHSSLEFGYDDNGEYEEAMGLDEPNIKTGFTTPLKRVETKYSKISKAKAGTYPKEFARRKLKKNYPTTDTNYDKWLFLLDLKEGLGEALEERTWADDFETKPTGVFSPETITNLRLTPSQIEKRHEWFYGVGLLKHPEEKVRYSNTEGNNSLTTKEVGKPERSERDDININDLEKSRFQPKTATFKHPLNYDIIQQLNGTTNVNGREVPNVYFRVQFIDDLGEKQTGYLMQKTQKRTNLGEFKLLTTA